MGLSITDLSTSMNAAKLTGEYGVKMLAKTMDNNEKLGQNLVQMIDAAAMERSVNPAVGGHFDMSV